MAEDGDDAIVRCAEGLLVHRATRTDATQGPKNRCTKAVAALALAAAVASLSGCAATTLAISKRDLDVQTRMSATVFLDPVRPEERSVFVQIRNTSDKPDFDVDADLRQAIEARGYRIVDDPDVAHYVLQANVLQVGRSAPTAAEAALRQGYGFGGGDNIAAAGTAALATYSLGSSDSRAMAGAALLGGIANSIGNVLVKDVYFTAITDIQIRQRTRPGTKATETSLHNLQQGISGGTTVTTAEQSEWKAYQTRVLSTANKANLEFSEAAPMLRSGLTRAIAGMF